MMWKAKLNLVVRMCKKKVVCTKRSDQPQQIEM